LQAVDYQCEVSWEISSWRALAIESDIETDAEDTGWLQLNLID
jgi:hypothetical protein